MMNIRRIWGVVLRHLHMVTEVNRLISFIYWPVLDIIMWGFTSLWIQGSEVYSREMTLSLLTGLVLWQLVGRASFEASLNLIEEMWSFNMLNLFSSPLTLPEWVTAMMILGVIMSSIITWYCIAVVWALYDLNVLSSGIGLLWYSIPLFISGLAMGFTASCIVIYFGARSYSIVYMMSLLFMPFTGALYPVSVLPSWIQRISYGLPMTYAFEGMRTLVLEHRFKPDYLVISTLMSLAYLAAVLALFGVMFNASKQRGFARLTAD